MVNVGKREDGLIDWANGYKQRFLLVLAQIHLYREGPLTANELLMLSIIEKLLIEESAEKKSAEIEESNG